MARIKESSPGEGRRRTQAVHPRSYLDDLRARALISRAGQALELKEDGPVSPPGFSISSSRFISRPRPSTSRPRPSTSRPQPSTSRPRPTQSNNNQSPALSKNSNSALSESSRKTVKQTNQPPKGFASSKTNSTSAPDSSSNQSPLTITELTFPDSPPPKMLPPPTFSFRTSNMINEPEYSGGATDFTEESQYSGGATDFMPAVHPGQEQYLDLNYSNKHPGQEQYLDPNYSSEYYLDPNINQSYSHSTYSHQNSTATNQPFGMSTVHSHPNHSTQHQLQNHTEGWTSNSPHVNQTVMSTNSGALQSIPIPHQTTHPGQPLTGGPAFGTQGPGPLPIHPSGHGAGPQASVRGGLPSNGARAPRKRGSTKRQASNPRPSNAPPPAPLQAVPTPPPPKKQPRNPRSSTAGQPALPLHTSTSNDQPSTSHGAQQTTITSTAGQPATPLHTSTSNDQPSTSHGAQQTTIASAVPQGTTGVHSGGGEDRAGDLAGEVETQETRGSKRKPNERKRLDPLVLESLRGLQLDQLRKKVAHHGHYKRLAAEDRVALDAAYSRYQQEVHLIAAERLLKPRPVLNHVGSLSRFRGPNMYINFCEYDIEARKVYYDKSRSMRERKRECGRLWRALDQQTKLKYKDIEFLKTLPNPFGRGECPGPDGGTSEASRAKNKKSRFYRSAETELWSRKVMLDLKNLGAAHDIEGFVMLYKGNSNEVVSGSSFMGEKFVDIFAKDKKLDISSNFLSFASGQEVIRKATGGREKNRDAAREKLNEAISKATHIRRKWPGKTTEKSLKKLGVTLRIKDNSYGINVSHFCGKPGAMGDEQLQKVLRAFAEDLVILTGPPAPEVPETLGADPEETSDKELEPSNSNKGECVIAKAPKKKITTDHRRLKSNTAGASAKAAKAARTTSTNAGKKRKRRLSDFSESGEDTPSSSSDDGDEDQDANFNDSDDDDEDDDDEDIDDEDEYEEGDVDDEVDD
ncbi:uncharacterized protein PGTG_17103 [Puccinia graminis f. sp. tritici CRL 75-36-700-3]|uniref:Uncharacterized protein n=1 Tax=Puccinia graminis f. sp. tritici (strain CRL 75-36-700-3 / race SCCL) TaxID=418459 RepID=E3L2X9_PUCGT|nr:uncharacterized protein PGTG_17103 [Puccinia graminis f. sp. tritici CRL 75-36-700-3]EFP90904.2 hypothetical protein PGTG_17103 [Puccinia graminis f. sp. tritici CRL 75-36-700-3]